MLHINTTSFGRIDPAAAAAIKTAAEPQIELTLTEQQFFHMKKLDYIWLQKHQEGFTYLLKTGLKTTTV